MRVPSFENGHESAMEESTEPGNVAFECWERWCFEVLPEKDLGGRKKCRIIINLQLRPEISDSTQFTELGNDGLQYLAPFPQDL